MEMPTRDGLRLVAEAQVARSAEREVSRADPNVVHLVQRTDVHYLDLDEDGVVDAVETIETVSNDGESDATPLVIVRTLQAEIDDAGTPHRVLGYTSCA